MRMKNQGKISVDDLQKLVQKLEKQQINLNRDNMRLRQSVSDFQNIFDQSSVISAVIGLNRLFIRCNSAFCNFLGYSDADLLGKSISFITYPEDLESGMQELIKKRSGSFTLKKRFVRKEGSIIWGEIKVSLVLDTNNKPIYFLPIINNINNREQSEKKLIESEERYKKLSAGLTDYLYTVIIKNGKALKTLHNDACKTITGYTSKEFSKDPYLWIKMVVPEERFLVSERFSNVMEGDDLPPLEHRIICKNGEIRWISDTVIPKYDPNGVLISYDGIIKDITSQKLAEKYGDINRQILSILNNPGDKSFIIKQAESKLIEMEAKYEKLAI